ncbi:nicotinate-nucleotide--dimethylbenzimidazole phosphoribosyltransferase [Bartonella bacilliformis]|uniref:Nicotinate-nucleotide--dimethylbenzimidazole phosphoribosyltransferase n=2 Tax=Bartonella bacilliformis TaxID=774 RepID=A1UT35_BARBK|nr:nicotinate-nucleotide--dimethylbenzimidazole phosphoribosyltransferase [Bartonella bacilliformis]ABM45473.1 nicotinate-nucleotide--dimethylbenzimidazole phosphoribosyltransferase [Bartonella bacilliformis KC583]AMG85927.1 nicotinate-nucleotide--dimethylbenzimidazole phosphoribosyltransferase [Bartonella bacilliformis]EKS43875.1 nicotinate-nucleotide--dimethylbenzimidazole phosphoribosyltransferase [Bartonella bacilliformis INS]EYS89857.1 nicotinate-nucleotide-dimethylbenzimidazole phosphorib
MTASPFDDFRTLLTNLPTPDEFIMTLAKKRQMQLTKLQGGLGKLGDIAVWYAGWRAEEKPIIRRPLVAIFSGNHGVTDENITPFPRSMTQQIVNNFAAGGGAINQICAAYDLGLKIFDLALEYPTMNITKDAAMDERSAAATMAFGMESIAGGIDLLCVGEMGIGNTTIASALCLALFGGDAEEWIDPGTGDVGEFYQRKVMAVKTAVFLHKDYLNDPFEVMRCLGGREIAAMVGAILAARMEKIPVILDSFVTTAAAAILYKMHPRALDHIIVGHISTNSAHRKLLEKIGKEPLLDLKVHLGEGIGAAMAAGVVKAAVLTHAQMAIFEQDVAI